MSDERQASATLPKIFIFVNSRWDRDCSCLAMAEDGTRLGGHISSSVGFARLDMGLYPEQDWTEKRNGYAAHYPDGYELVDLLDLDVPALKRHEGLTAAIAHAEQKQADALRDCTFSSSPLAPTQEGE